MKVTGGCHCGAITYEAEVDPEKCAICHCSDCQTISGTAFRTVVVATPGTLKVTGTPKEYIKTAQSGNKRVQAFCGDCGSSLWATSTDPDPKPYNLRLGSVHQREQFSPKVQIWHRSSQPWLPGLDDIKKVEEQPPM